MVIIELPKDVRYIIDILTQNGYEAYAVGGCVRDSILGRVPGDWDITTSALPQQVKALFRRTIDTGIQHGTVTIMLGKNGYEVTTYRIDGKYEDSRHPGSVEFTPNLEEDLKRRDFTINAMAYNDENGVVDIFGGIDDIRNRIIRCVGNAHDRFTEDALRILRAVRFSAQLGFEIDKATKDAARELAPTLVKISRERIHTELNKLLLSDNPDYFSVVYELGVMKVIISELEGVNSGDIDRLKVLIKRTKPCLPERYAALLSVIGKDKTRAVLKGLKLDNATISMAVKLVEYLGITPALTEPQMRHYINEVGKEDALRVIDFNLSFADESMHEEYTDMRKLCAHVLERGDCTSLKELDVTGKDLVDAGFEAGKQLGELLNSLLTEVLDNPSLNDRNYLLGRAKELGRR
ncbi:poly A polymerase [Firmicutes bacterium CAG:882]|nr:poly A polymerase [Firmicutes bacterium CAG:882]